MFGTLPFINIVILSNSSGFKLVLAMQMGMMSSEESQVKEDKEVMVVTPLP